MKSTVRDLLNFHAPESTTLFDHVPQDLLPNEYGGKAGSMNDIKKSFVKKLELNRWVLLKVFSEIFTEMLNILENISQTTSFGNLAIPTTMQQNSSQTFKR